MKCSLTGKSTNARVEDGGSNPPISFLREEQQWKKVNVLGTEYKIIREEMKDAEYDGYCDYTSKIIKLRTDNVNKLGDFDCLMKKQLRHEIIHAFFLYESGLGPNFEHYKQFGHEETIVDWFAIQFPKIVEAFKSASAL